MGKGGVLEGGDSCEGEKQKPGKGSLHGSPSVQELSIISPEFWLRLKLNTLHDGAELGLVEILIRRHFPYHNNCLTGLLGFNNGDGAIGRTFEVKDRDGVESKTHVLFVEADSILKRGAKVENIYVWSFKSLLVLDLTKTLDG